ncbi:MAG: DUF3298 and DUF4163 domain-containing protein [Desulfobacterales bacterium]|nr:DUF3298 and DUF4163 domain-containing protein [Desulfobacterales bacterium]
MKLFSFFRPCLRIAVGAVFLAGCAAPTPTPAPPISADRWKTRTFERTVGNCDAPRPDCAAVVLRYPVSTATPPDPLDEAVSWFVEEQILAPVVTEVRAPDLEALAAQFVYEYEQVKRELTDYRSRWFLKREVSVVHASSRVASLCFSEIIYTGGAHPNSRKRYQSFDATTGRAVEMEDLLVPGARRRFDAVAERIFRQTHGILPDVTLTEAGFWFESGRFALNDNFAVIAEGVLFYFNPYEIASYAAGPTELLIPFSELKGLLQMRWL